MLILFFAGYIGGSVLARLLAHPDAKNYDITVLVRSEDKAKKFETFGVSAIVGSFTESKLVEELSEQAHAIFSIVSSTLRPGCSPTNSRLGEFR